MILVYVDDILLACKDRGRLDQLKRELAARFTYALTSYLTRYSSPKYQST